MTQKSDFHIYLDSKVNILKDLNSYISENSFDFVIASPPCTMNSEPDKSQFAYKVQHFLTSFRFGLWINYLVGLLFYKSSGDLRTLMRLFTKHFSNYQKVICPLNSVSDFNIQNVKYWLWVNPRCQRSIEDLSRINNTNIFGLKLHCSWHNLSIKEIEPILNNFKLTKPIYIVLPHNKTKAIQIIEYILKDYKHIYIFGYGGFPFTSLIVKAIARSNHIFTDTASGHLSQKNLKLLSKIDSNKLLYSTDWPYNFKDRDSNLFSSIKFNSNLVKNDIDITSIFQNYPRGI